MPPTLQVDTDAAPDPANPSLPSAVISIPESWGSTSTPHNERATALSPGAELSPKEVPHRMRGSVDMGIPQPEPPIPLSATSSSSSSKPIFAWPASSGVSSTRPDPFDSTRSFYEDPFGQSSSSSSGDDIDMARPQLAHTLTNWQAVVTPAPLAGEQQDAGPSEERLSAISRTFSSPIPNRVGGLQPLRRQSVQHDPWHTVSRELIDSLQTAIQTLLYVSPPHLLDNAKEQYSGCAIQMPATSVSALFTSMRGLNYLSANLATLAEGQGAGVKVIEDFDIGELLQNVADQLSGEVAQAEVDLVLFHGDVGMKHVNMNGDKAGIAYVLGHVLRQTLAVVNKGDTIEMGLQIIPQSPNTRRVSIPAVHHDLDQYRRRASTQSASSIGEDGTYLCVFELIHNVAQNHDSNAATPKAELNPFTRLAEQKEAATPRLDTPLCRSLLRQVNAWLKTDTVPSSPSSFGLPRHGYELSVILSRGQPIVEPVPLSEEEEATRQPFSSLQLPREPTLGELAEFTETLRGRKVNLHASLSSIFARHLTSYLAAWGLDVSHIPIEEEVNGNDEVDPQQPKFIIIDEDIQVLRRELLKLRPDPSAMILRQRSLKRPGLFRSAKSTMAVRQSATAVIHFTSIDKYHQVRDVVASLGMMAPPEVMVVPKPVGPRRFLTALFTAVKQPPVDPAFSPIATSPRSPQINSGNRTPTNGLNGLQQEGFFDAVDLLSDKPVRSPLGEVPPASAPLPRTTSDQVRFTPGNDVVTTPAAEYFSRTAPPRTPISAAANSSAGASGVVIQSPDGRPYGMFFEPPSSSRSTSFSQRSSRGSRQASLDSGIPTVDGVDGSRRTSNTSIVSGNTEESGRTTRTTSAESLPTANRRKTLPTQPDAKPILAHGRNRSATVTRRQIADGQEKPLPLPVPEKVWPRVAAKGADVVIPPINVLIVEDNPINQNILSMFFRKKKIKHQTAKDGFEAVEKWRTGGFHLILMDIQLPVMDGIEATKEIRKLEKNNNIGVFPSTPVGEKAETPGSSMPASSPFRSAVIIVALTASSLQTDRVAALAAGCNDFLTKPVSLKWLEKKTVEWGCMQALIDFDGWRRWKGSDTAETKRHFQLAPEAAARTVASRLRIERIKRPKSAQSAQSAQSGQSISPTPTHATSISPTPSMASAQSGASKDSLDAALSRTKSPGLDVQKPKAKSPKLSPGREKPLPALPVE